MQPFTSLTGRAVSLRRGEVDTDQIIPAEYLKRVSRTGFGDGLFAAWRADPDFVLNQPHAEGAEILIAGPDFGIGSSREHAPQAILRWKKGIQAIIGESFAEILFGNCVALGIPCVVVDEKTIAALMDTVEKDPSQNGYWSVDVVQAGRYEFRLRSRPPGVPQPIGATAARVIIVSAIDQNNVLDEALSLGASGFIVKPFNAKSLTESLRSLMADISSSPTHVAAPLTGSAATR